MASFYNTHTKNKYRASLPALDDISQENWPFLTAAPLSLMSLVCFSAEPLPTKQNKETNNTQTKEECGCNSHLAAERSKKSLEGRDKRCTRKLCRMGKRRLGSTLYKKQMCCAVRLQLPGDTFETARWLAPPEEVVLAESPPLPDG